MPRNRPQLETASLAQAVTTALRRSPSPLLTVEVVASVVRIAGYRDASLSLVAAQVRQTLRHLERRNAEVVMTGTRGQRLWAIVEID